MASPPFNVNQSLPGDTDIVSQHPPNARTFRDVVESWLGINHDTNGNHFRVDIPRSASPTTPAASIDVLFTSTTGRLKIKHPDGSEEFVGIPPGYISYSATAAQGGWLFADGSAVSRSTYADLFNVIATSYGVGDNVTTFNLPDLRGRVAIGVDNGAGRISVPTFNTITLSGVGGNEQTTLVSSNVPGGVSISLGSLTVSVPTINVSGSITGSSTGQTASGSVSGTASGGIVTGTPTGFVAGTASVTSTTGNTATGTIQSANVTGGADRAFTSNAVNQTIASSGNIAATFTGSGLSGGSLSSPATVTASFSGAAVSTGAVSGTFTGTGTGSGTVGGSAVTSGSAVAFSNIPPAMVLYPLIKS